MVRPRKPPAASGSNYFVIAFDLSDYAMAAINSAQVRLRSGQGNTAMQYAGIKSHDWAEGNKNNDYPGNTPYAPGVCWAHPAGTYTSPWGDCGWGTNSDSMFNVTSDGPDIYALTNFSSAPGGLAWCVADITSLAQDWVTGAKPNYGMLISYGNHSPYLSESNAADEPVLFLDYTLQQGQLAFSPGTTTQNVLLNIVDDAVAEGNETIVITLSNPTGATLGTNTSLHLHDRRQRLTRAVCRRGPLKGFLMTSLPRRPSVLYRGPSLALAPAGR